MCQRCPDYSDAQLTLQIQLARRYDHFGRSSALEIGVTKAPAGEAVPVPRTVGTRACPMYRVAMISLLVSYLVADVSVHALFATGILQRSDDETFMLMVLLASFLVPTLIVPAATISYAWSKGEARNWWMYSET